MSWTMRQRLTRLLKSIDTHATAGDPTIRGFLRAREGPATRLAGRHDDLDVVERKRQEAQILQQAAPGGQGIGRGICDPLVVSAPPVGVAQKEDSEGGIDQQHIFHRMAFFLATITVRLLNRVLGVRDAPFHPSSPKGGTQLGSGPSRAARPGAVASPSA